MVMVIGLGYGLKVQIENVGELKSKLVQIQQEKIDLENQIENEKSRSIVLNNKVSDAVSNYNKIKGELDSHKRRYSVIVKKPGLVELKINKSFNSFMNEMYCSTGDKEKCSK